MKHERIYHTWEKWECYPAGFYATKPPTKELTEDDCRNAYAEFLRDMPRFEAALQRVTKEWVKSCEHYLTNENMNRIAWLGQASLCIATGIPSFFCGGFNRLSPEAQYDANMMALKWLNRWLVANGRPQLMLGDAQSKTKADLY